MDKQNPLSIKPPVLRSFEPLITKRSRVLILGSMPGPVALKRQQYYGFDGNHFWTVLPAVFGLERPATYADKKRFVKKHKVALWDVLHSCQRKTALDVHIRCPVPNDIPGLIKKYPGLRAIFINGRTAHTLFKRYFGKTIDRPYFYLPSTSPAHAALSVDGKIAEWKKIKKFLASS